MIDSVSELEIEEVYEMQGEIAGFYLETTFITESSVSLSQVVFRGENVPRSSEKTDRRLAEVR